MKSAIGFIAVLLLIGCSSKHPNISEFPAPVTLTKDVCSREPELCEKSCADCKDRKDCMLNNGVCKTGGLHFNDSADTGNDIWTPGCHYEYKDAACTQNQNFFLGDICGTKNPKEIIEWTVSACHGAIGDREIFDCDKECKRADLGRGTCVVVPNVCAGKDSAACKCDKPLPTP